MDWIYGPLHEALYILERLIASVGWGFNASILYVVELIERFRLLLVTAGFRPAIQTVADQVLGISRSTLELGLVLGLLLLILQPVLVTRWVNLRKVLVLLLVVPLLLPFGGAIFQEVEQARADLGSAFFERIFNGSRFDLLPADEERTGADRDMGPLIAYTPGSTSLHGIDVAAAYLYAVRADVITPDSPPPNDLPDAFAERYFPYTPEELGNLPTPQRWAAIEDAGQGIIRTFYGGLIVVFALSESVVNLTFTLGLGLLLIGLLISLVFAWAAPVEHITANLLRKIAELILTSWGLSAIQGLLLAAIIDVATSGNAVATLGMGTLGLVMETAFAILAAKTIAGALIGVASAGSAGGITEQHVQGGAQVVGGAALTAVTGGLGAVTAAGGTALAYGAALRQGAPRGYAAGYALSRSRTLANVGALAQAMGAVSPDSDMMQGLYSGSVIGRGEPLSLRSQKALQRDTSQHREQREQQAQALGTLATVSLIQQRHQATQQDAADAQEARFTGTLARNRYQHRNQVVATTDVNLARLDRTDQADLRREVEHRLLSPLLPVRPRDAQAARQAAADEVQGQYWARFGTPMTVDRVPTAPVNGPGYLAALQAHADTEVQYRRPFWQPTSGEHVSAAGAPQAASALAQEPIPPQVVVEHVTQHATAPGTVITPEVYTRTVTPAPADTRIATATAALHTQYQAQRTTTATPPSDNHAVTRPRRRGPNLTPKERR